MFIGKVEGEPEDIGRVASVLVSRSFESKSCHRPSPVLCRRSLSSVLSALFIDPARVCTRFPLSEDRMDREVAGNVRR